MKVETEVMKPQLAGQDRTESGRGGSPLTVRFRWD